MPLLYALRDDLGLNNPKFGCGLAQCGACTVHLDGQPIRSCVTPVSLDRRRQDHDARRPRHAGEAAPAQTAYVEEQVPQCGYCINGWIMTAAAFLLDKKNPTRRGNQGRALGMKCRCGTPCSIMTRSSAPPTRWVEGGRDQM